MGRIWNEIDSKLKEFMESSPVFFVATAPLSENGHVNCSPKGNRGELVVLGQKSVAYLDQTGSGIETVSHLSENGRITLMFCAFVGPPRIVRIHGSGSVIKRDEPSFAEMIYHFKDPATIGARSIVVVESERISDSCGYGVPLMDFVSHRDQMNDSASRKGEDGIRKYWMEKNQTSIDGLPGL
ncbi:MAG: pyridoxamine 5'-phosphate oxidase family protein [Acidimicrobiales bacterium]|nr:pyridoxamine 5'-phosphate oxidase family protein [Acidimicrobiales bacterium]